MKILLKNLKETKRFIKKIKNLFLKKKIVLLIGELGAGKTTYVKFLAKELKIKEVLQSPTFILWQRYEFSFKNKKYYLNHLDLYRLKNIREILKLDLRKEIFKKNNLFLIEWGEKIEGYLKRKKIKYLKVEIKIVAKNQRLVEIK